MIPRLYRIWMYGSCEWNSGECDLIVELTAPDVSDLTAMLRRAIIRQDISDFNIRPFTPLIGFEAAVAQIKQSLRTEDL
jgi:hypothetical protein